MMSLDRYPDIFQSHLAHFQAWFLFHTRIPYYRLQTHALSNHCYQLSTDREHDFRITILTCLMISFYTEWRNGHSIGLSTGRQNGLGVVHNNDFIYLSDLCFLTFDCVRVYACYPLLSLPSSYNKTNRDFGPLTTTATRMHTVVGYVCTLWCWTATTDDDPPTLWVMTGNPPTLCVWLFSQEGCRNTIGLLGKWGFTWERERSLQGRIWM